MRVDEGLIFRARRETTAQALEAAQAFVDEWNKGRTLGRLALAPRPIEVVSDPTRAGVRDFQVWISPDWRGYDGS